MKNTLRIFALIAALLASLNAASQTLWQSTKHGMSIEETAKAVPGSIAPVDAAGRLANGAVEKLRLESYEVAGRQFQVKLYFLGEALEQVTLSLSETVTYDSARVIYERLRQALSSLYGPVEELPEKRGILSLRQADWRSGRTNISLLAMGVGQSPATLNINYQVRVARDADKL